jgi:hypothetical protein
MRPFLDKIENQISGWPHIAVHPHRFGGREFRFGRAEVGHIHSSGTVDIPFPRAFRDELLGRGLAEEHRWVPDSGWVTFHIRSEDDVAQAIWLMRLSYLRFALKAASDPTELLKREGESLHLVPRFVDLLQRFVRSIPAAPDLPS